MISVKMDGKLVAGVSLENFPHAARWFANNGTCHGAKESVCFEFVEEKKAAEEETSEEPKNGATEQGGAELSLPEATAPNTGEGADETPETGKKGFFGNPKGKKNVSVK
jgi:hypothetical protein